MKEALQLLGQLIEIARAEDAKHKEEALAKHKGSQAIGDSFMLFHLQQLKLLLEKETGDET